MRHRFVRLWHLPVLVAATLAARCSLSPRPIRIGLAGPAADSAGAAMKRAAQLAVAQINAAGGVRGRPLALDLRDDFGNPDSAMVVAASLAASNVVAVIGHAASATSLAAAAIYNQARVPQLTPSASSHLLTQAGEYTFRISPTDLQVSAAMARFVADKLGFRQGAILYTNDEYGRGLRATFAREFVALGGTIDETDPYLGRPPAVGPYLDRIAIRQKAQFLFLGGSRDEAVDILQAARERGLRLTVLGGNALEGLETAGPIAEGTYISTAYLSSFNSPRNREFVLKYSRKYPFSPLPSQPAAATYDLVYLLRDVIERVGTSRTAVRDAVSRIGRGDPAFEGVTGTIAFDEHGDVPRQRVVIGRVSGGQMIAVDGL